MQEIIHVNNVSYSYPNTSSAALKNISFKVAAGEFIAVIGPTGAGKSSLCYSFNGAIPRLFGGEMKGSIIVAGLDTYENEIPVLAQHVGLVVQNARNQLFNVTVETEVAFGCENLGLAREIIRNRVTESLAFVGLEGYEKREPTALSGGQQQRVAIACVLAMQPDVLILDEPTSELDPLGSEQVMGVIARLNRELGKTVILVSHDTGFVAQYANRVLVLNEGCLIADDTPKNIFSKIELLRTAKIRPPQVCEIAFEMIRRGMRINDIPITVEEAVQLFQKRTYA